MSISIDTTDTTPAFNTMNGGKSDNTFCCTKCGDVLDTVIHIGTCDHCDLYHCYD